jgi:hypothetical protein
LTTSHIERFHPHVLESAFDGRVVGAMHAHLLGKVFLADVERFPTSPEGVADALL